MGPLAQLAERYNLVVICIRHLTKGGRDKAIYVAARAASPTPPRRA